MPFLIGKRRAVVRGLARILEATRLEELFDGPPETALVLLDLLRTTARGRDGPIYREICEAARRRGVSADYVVDRATVFLASIAERQRNDLYRALRIPPLASAELIGQRWIELTKEPHADSDADRARFRELKEAYEILCDPEQRTEYERFWLQVLARLEPMPPAQDRAPAPPEPASESPLLTSEWPLSRRESPAAERDLTPAHWTGALRAATRLVAERDAFERKLASGKAGESVFALAARLEAHLAPIGRREIEVLLADVERGIGLLEEMRAELDRLAQLKRSLAM